MVPLTFCFPWCKGSREERKQWMREFAEAGANHLVLTSELLGRGCADTGFLMDFSRDMSEFGLDFVDSHALWGTWSDPGMPLAEWREALLLRHKLTFRFCAGFCFQAGECATRLCRVKNRVFKIKMVVGDGCKKRLRFLVGKPSNAAF